MSAPPLQAAALHRALVTLLRELVDGASANACWVLNRNDPGLLQSLEHLSADTASKPGPAGGASVAAHVDHLRYGFELLNRYTRGEEPFSTADWAASWRRGTVSEDQWAERRKALADELNQWRRFLEVPREVSEVELTGMLASAIHLGYHLGAIRQIAPSSRGPREPG